MEDRASIWIIRKFVVYLIKIIPMLLALLALLNTVFSYYGIDLPILSYLGGVSVLTLLLLYLLSYAFKFCMYHRLFLHYMTLNWILNIYDYHIGIPMSDKSVYIFYLVITGIFTFLALYYHQKCKKEGKLKNMFV